MKYYLFWESGFSGCFNNEQEAIDQGLAIRQLGEHEEIKVIYGQELIYDWKLLKEKYSSEHKD